MDTKEQNMQSAAHTDREVLDNYKDMAREVLPAASAMLSALEGMVGLVQLVRARADCPIEIKQALTAHYRLDDAFAAIAAAKAAGI
jgi:hypothetical protein